MGTMESDAYSEFFEQHHDSVKNNRVELILFAMSFFRLALFSDEILESLAHCPEQQPRMSKKTNSLPRRREGLK